MAGKGSLQVSRLISEVHRRPELWDRQHPQHHNKSVLELQWDTVASMIDMNGKAARGKWKNLKDHFRKEYKRSMMAMDGGDSGASRWPYFRSMMFVKDQISYAVADSLYLSDFQRPDDGGGGGGGGGDSVDCSPLNCLDVQYGTTNDSRPERAGTGGDQDENMSDDKHFLLSLVPMFSVLAPEKKLKARIAIETALLGIAYPELKEQPGAPTAGEQDDAICPSDKRKRPAAVASRDERLHKRSTATAISTTTTTTTTTNNNNHNNSSSNGSGGSSKRSTPRL